MLRCSVALVGGEHLPGNHDLLDLARALVDAQSADLA
jgi:hypothetical protein